MELKIKALSPKIGTDIPLPRFATAGVHGPVRLHRPAGDAGRR